MLFPVICGVEELTFVPGVKRRRCPQLTSRARGFDILKRRRMETTEDRSLSPSCGPTGNYIT